MNRLLVPVLIAAAGCASTRATSPVSAVSAAASRPAEAAPTDLDEEVGALLIRMYADDHEVRRSAARRLGALGGRAAPALPELVACAATEPREAGEVPGDLGAREPREECARAIAAVGAENPAALVAALAIPLPAKQRALAALTRVGELAAPGAAAVYLDACDRYDDASDAAVRRHLAATAASALAVLTGEPNPATGSATAGDACPPEESERVRALAMGR